MTDRLYYHDSFLYDFDAQVVEAPILDGKPAIVLDRTAFYPTSGGQVHDTGKLIIEGGRELTVTEVSDEDTGRIFHFVPESLSPGTAVHGTIDASRRRDHMQQHSGQHVLSAAFIRLFNMPTVSFHMGEESCTIDLQANGLTPAQVEQAEKLANEVVLEDRPATIRFVSLDDARTLGLRKLPPKQTGDLRLIDIKEFDLTACGGTHVRSTGQIGAILLRKVEKVKQGVRVEFVCGLRVVATARKDYSTLTEAAAIYSAHIHDLPQQVRKSLDEVKSAGKAQHKLLEELAKFTAESMRASASGSPCVLVRFFPERDAAFVKLVAQKLTAGQSDVVALLASGAGQPTLVFAQTPGSPTRASRGGVESPSQKFNMGQLLKDALVRLGGRGGGTADMAQGGLPMVKASSAEIEKVLADSATKLKSGAGGL